MSSNTKTKNHGYVDAVGIAAELGRTYSSIDTNIACTTATQLTDVIDIRESGAASFYFSVTLNSATYVDIGIQLAGTVSGTYYKYAILDTSSSGSAHTFNTPLIRITSDDNYRWAIPVASNYMKVSYISDSATAVIDTLGVTLSAQTTAFQTKPYDSTAVLSAYTDAVYIKAGSFILAHDANFAPVETLTGSNVSRMAHAFDYTTTEFVRYEYTVPAAIDTSGDVVFTFSWKPRVAPGDDQDVVWEVESVAIAEGEVWDTALASKGTVTSAASTTTDQITIESLTISVSNMGWAANDTVVLKFSRDSDGNDLDTLDNRANTDDDALLFGISMKVPLT